MRGSEWAPLYLLVVLAIAAILLVTFVKPMFRQASVQAEKNAEEARDVAKSLAPLLLWPAGLGVGRKRKATAAKKNKRAKTRGNALAETLFFRDFRHPVSGGV